MAANIKHEFFNSFCDIWPSEAKHSQVPSHRGSSQVILHLSSCMGSLFFYPRMLSIATASSVCVLFCHSSCSQILFWGLMKRRNTPEEAAFSTTVASATPLGSKRGAQNRIIISIFPPFGRKCHRSPKTSNDLQLLRFLIDFNLSGTSLTCMKLHDYPSPLEVGWGHQVGQRLWRGCRGQPALPVCTLALQHLPPPPSGVLL